MFDKPVDVFESQIFDLFSKKDKDEKHILLEILSILFYQNKNASEIADIYDEMGLDNLSKLVNIFDGREVKLPTRAEFEETLILSLCYYYREIHSMEWSDIKEKLPFEISSVTYGRRMKKINKNLRDQVMRLFSEL